MEQLDSQFADFHENWRLKIFSREIFRENSIWLYSYRCVDALDFIYIALEFVPTPTACCAASTKPWTETILDDVPHYPVGQSVSDTGRPGKNDGILTFLFVVTSWLRLIIRTFVIILNGFNVLMFLMFPFFLNCSIYSVTFNIFTFTGRIGEW